MTSEHNGRASGDGLSDSPSAPQLLVSRYDDACLAPRSFGPNVMNLWKPLLAMHRAGVRDEDEAVLRARRRPGGTKKGPAGGAGEPFASGLVQAAKASRLALPSASMVRSLSVVSSSARVAANSLAASGIFMISAQRRSVP